MFGCVCVSLRGEFVVVWLVTVSCVVFHVVLHCDVVWCGFVRFVAFLLCCHVLRWCCFVPLVMPLTLAIYAKLRERQRKMHMPLLATSKGVSS